jgi:maltose alpha-D-glucosyltransferase / alpha-amylase
MATLPDNVRDLARNVVANQNQIIACFAALLNRKLTVPRMRIHGDLHLGQLLYTGKDFVIVDFEGEPARPLSDRRRKRAALQDVAGMLRSFQYAALTGMLDLIGTGSLGKVRLENLSQWANFWQTWSSWAFLKSYRDTARNSPLIPKDREELRVALDAFVMEKAVYELGYELNNRPERLAIPAQGILNLIGADSGRP